MLSSIAMSAMMLMAPSTIDDMSTQEKVSFLEMTDEQKVVYLANDNELISRSEVRLDQMEEVQIRTVQKTIDELEETIKKDKEVMSILAPPPLPKPVEKKQEVQPKAKPKPQQTTPKANPSPKPSAPKTQSQPQAKAPQGKTLTVTATAYTANCSGCTGITATGINLHANPNAKVIAVDPKVIPLGTKVYVEGYGTAIAGDTGGAIKGNKIDLFFSSHNKAIQFGRQTLTITILD